MNSPAVRTRPAPMVASGLARTIHRICKAACVVCRVNECEFHGHGRHPLVVRARRLAILAVRRNTLASYPETEAATGVRHSTWVDRHRLGSAMLATDPDFARQLAEVEAMMGVSSLGS